MGAPVRMGTKKIDYDIIPEQTIEFKKDPSNPVAYHTFEDGSYFVIADTPEIRKFDVGHLNGCMAADYWTEIEKGLRFALSLRNKEGKPIAWLHGGDYRVEQEYSKFSRYFMYSTMRAEDMKGVKILFNKPWRAYEFYKSNRLSNRAMYVEWWLGLPDWDSNCTTYDSWPQEIVAMRLGTK